MNYSNPINVGEQQSSRSLTLTGNVIAPSPAVEQDLAFRFADNLRKSEIFSKAFKSIDPSVHKNEAGEEGGNPVMDPSQADSKLELRTQFIIGCSNVKKT